MTEKIWAPISSPWHPFCGYVIFYDRVEIAEAIMTADELPLEQGTKPGFPPGVFMDFKIRNDI